MKSLFSLCHFLAIASLIQSCIAGHFAIVGARIAKSGISSGPNLTPRSPTVKARTEEFGFSSDYNFTVGVPSNLSWYGAQGPTFINLFGLSATNDVTYLMAITGRVSVLCRR